MGRIQVISLFAFIVWMGSLHVSGQSTEQSAPTVVPGSEVVSSIKARQEGDPRLTTHYFSIDVRQGDLYLNVIHRNFVGDVDVFSIDGRRPLGKLTIVESTSEREIGKVVFIRAPGSVLVRVEGRTLNNDEGHYRLKFGGSALANRILGETLDFRTVRIDQIALDVAPRSIERNPEVVSTPRRDDKSKESPVTSIETRVTDEKKEDARTENVSKSPEVPLVSNVQRDVFDWKTDASVPAKLSERKLFLRIEFDDGGKLERPMSSVARVTIEKDQLVVLLANGSESRYPISSVVRFSVD